MTLRSILVLLLLMAVTTAAVVTVLRQTRPARKQLVVVLIVALGLRLAAVLAMEVVTPWQLTRRGAVTPDEAVVDYAARLLAQGDDRSPVTLGGSLHTSWLLVASGVYGVWDSFLALRLVNVLLGTVLVLPAYVLGRDLAGERVGQLAAWAVAVFPNAVVWSALGLREPLVGLLLLLVLTLGLRALRARPAPSWAAIAALTLPSAVALVGLGYSRSYMVPLLMVLLLGTGLLAAALGRSVRPLVACALIVAVATGLTFAAPRGPELVEVTSNLASEQTATIYNPFSDCSDETRCDVGEAEAAREALSSSKPPGRDAPPAAAPIEESLQSVSAKGPARAFAIAVLAGRPVWETREYFFLLQPGVVLWWTVLPFVLAGYLALARRKDLPALALLGGYTAGVVVFLAFSGQFIRHHFMIEPLSLVIAAVGVAALRSAPRRLRRTVVAAAGAGAAAALASVAQSLT